jgi:hypothetical protein
MWSPRSLKWKKEAERRAEWCHMRTPPILTGSKDGVKGSRAPRGWKKAGKGIPWRSSRMEWSVTGTWTLAQYNLCQTWLGWYLCCLKSLSLWLICYNSNWQSNIVSMATKILLKTKFRIVNEKCLITTSDLIIFAITYNLLPFSFRFLPNMWIKLDEYLILSFIVTINVTSNIFICQYLKT